MGKIKSTLIKRKGKKLVVEAGFTEDFDNNKRILSSTMPSKKIKNMLSGYIARLKKQEKQAQKQKQLHAASLMQKSYA